MRRYLTVCLVLLATVLPSLASYSDLQPSVVGYTNSTVTISVYNPNTQSETGRVQLTVQLDNGTRETLTSSNFTVMAGQSLQVQLTATRPVTTVFDTPEPIEPL